MRRYSILTVSCLFCFQLAGCWVRIPDNNHPDYSPYIGKTAKTTVDLYVQDFFFRLSKFAVDDKQYLIKGRDYMTLPAGSVLKITGIVYRRLEPGVCHYFTCAYQSEGKSIIFDYEISDFIKGKWIDAPYLEFTDPPPSHPRQGRAINRQ